MILLTLLKWAVSIPWFIVTWVFHRLKSNASSSDTDTKQKPRHSRPAKKGIGHNMKDD